MPDETGQEIPGYPREGVEDRIYKKAQELRERSNIEHTVKKTLLPETPKEEALSKLPENDRRNVEELTTIVQQLLKGDGAEGAVILIGGVLDKVLPRKDIDIALYLKSPSTFESYRPLRRTQRTFVVVRSYAEDIANMINGAKVGEIDEPRLEKDEKGQEWINQGTVSILRDGYTPIQIKGEYGNEIEDAIYDRSNYSILARVENQK